MACTNGTERKPGTPDKILINVREIVCALYGETSPFCYLTLPIPFAYLNADSFCGSQPPATPDINTFDFLNLPNVAEKLFEVAQSRVWGNYCRCKPGVPTPPPFNGGQCNCVSYTINFRWFRTDDNFLGELQTFSVRGPILGRRIVNFGNFKILEINCRTDFNLGNVCAPQGWYNILTVSNRAADNLIIHTFQVIDPAPGSPGDCGDAPGEEAPPLEPDPPAPPPSFPTDLEPPPPPPDCANCPPGEQGEKGEKGDDAVVEFESVEVNALACNEDGTFKTEPASVSVIKSDDGSMSDFAIKLFSTIALLGEKCPPTAPTTEVVGIVVHPGSLINLTDRAVRVKFEVTVIPEWAGRRRGESSETSTDDLIEAGGYSLVKGLHKSAETRITWYKQFVDVENIDGVRVYVQPGFEVTVSVDNLPEVA